MVICVLRDPVTGEYETAPVESGRAFFDVRRLFPGQMVKFTEGIVLDQFLCASDRSLAQPAPYLNIDPFGPLLSLEDRENAA